MGITNDPVNEISFFFDILATEFPGIEVSPHHEKTRFTRDPTSEFDGLLKSSLLVTIIWCFSTDPFTADECFGAGGDPNGCKTLTIDSNDGMDCTIDSCIGIGGDSNGCQFTTVDLIGFDGITCTIDSCIGAVRY